ncbi:hypothetical protein ACQ4M3_32205 [Leptolyngbya sp. AN03gr2]|uniref:hypothetical protein n=1 Tax=unclassified Leptolyngbya TaxID=2650499 RepID=UPI003D3244A3
MLKTLGIVVPVVVAGVGLGKVIKEPLNNLMGTTVDAPSPRSTPSLPPVAVPPTGVLENYATSTASNTKETASSIDAGSGKLRIYSAPSKAPDGSGFHKECPETENSALLKKQHYFVRVVEWNSNQMVLTAFIRAGEKVDLKLPSDSYKIRYATGIEWYGEKHLFGEETRYTQLMEKDSSEQPLKVKLSQQNWDIALFPCGAEGNMTQEPIDPDQF